VKEPVLLLVVQTMVPNGPLALSPNTVAVQLAVEAMRTGLGERETDVVEFAGFTTSVIQF
jgi:hypothetical protein